MSLRSINIILTFCVFFILIAAVPASASGLIFKPQVGIGGEFTKNANVTVSPSTQTIGEYIKQIYKYAIGIVGIVAVVVMMIGGVLWMTAGGNPNQVGSAQQYITGALTGLVLVMFSYVILKTVNPDLVSFKVHEIKKVEVSKKSTSADNYTYAGCCDKSTSGMCFDVEKKEDCDEGFTENKPCEQIKECPQYNCSVSSVDGDECSTVDLDNPLSNAFGYCFDGICRTGKGEPGQKCGYKDNVGICDQTCDFIFGDHISTGRGCNGLLYFCCRH